MPPRFFFVVWNLNRRTVWYSPMTFKIRVRSNVCPVLCGLLMEHKEYFFSVWSKFVQIKTLLMLQVFIRACISKSRDHRLILCGELTQQTNNRNKGWNTIFGVHTHSPAQRNHKLQPAKGSNYAPKQNLQFQLNLLVPHYLPLLWLIIREGHWLLGTDEDLAVSGNIFGGGGL